MAPLVRTSLALLLACQVAQTWSLRIPVGDGSLARRDDPPAPAPANAQPTPNAAPAQDEDTTPSLLADALDVPAGSTCSKAMRALAATKSVRESCGLLEIRSLLEAKYNSQDNTTKKFVLDPPGATVGVKFAGGLLNLGSKTPLDAQATEVKVKQESAMAAVVEGLCQKTCSGEALDAIKKAGEACDKDTPVVGAWMQIAATTYEPLRASLCQRQFFEDPAGQSCLQKFLEFDVDKASAAFPAGGAGATQAAPQVLAEVSEPVLAEEKPDPMNTLCTTCNFELGKNLFKYWQDNEGSRDPLRKLWAATQKKAEGGAEGAAASPLDSPESFAFSMAFVCSPNLGILRGIAIKPF